MPTGTQTPLRRIRSWADPQVMVVLGALLLGLLLPATGGAAEAFGTLRTAAIVVLFFLYGARIATGEVWAGLKNWRLQGSMLAATFVVFPVLGLLVQLLPDAVLDQQLKTGLLYLSLLPSTVQTSVVFTSTARGNVAGALTGAAISNLAGIVLTPLLVGLLLVRTGSVSAGNSTAIVLQLLLPFALGQLCQPRIGAWLRARPWLTRTSDRVTIGLVAYVSVSEATVSGVWSHVTVGALATLLVVCAAMLATMLVVTWNGGRGMDTPDRIALLMVGSKKSLATGLPMAAVLFTPAVAASVALPVIAFHQLQLAACAVLARRLANRVQ